MESSASSHMTGDQGNLTQYFHLLFHSSCQIVVGIESRLPILGTGHTHIHAPPINFRLAFILHTPALVSNLISVCKFTKDNWCSIEFDSFGFFVKDIITKTPILRSNSLGDLYPFAGFSTVTNMFALSTVVSSVDVWHRRPGHPSSASLSTLLSRFHIPCQNKSSTPSISDV
jgi:hypothetical protein